MKSPFAAIRPSLESVRSRGILRPLRSLTKRGRDRRPWVYSLADLEAGRTHDPLWNAAQMQLVREGRLHNYLRMLWGKKILEW
jgi:deoxyribodipyrimidine photo-lyase